MGFVRTKYENQSDDWPDIQFFLTSFSDNTDGGIVGKRAAGITDECYSAVYEEILYKESFNIITLLLKPRSRGRIMLKDKNPNSKVLIYPNYFDDPQDLRVMVSGSNFWEMRAIFEKYGSFGHKNFFT